MNTVDLFAHIADLSAYRPEFVLHLDPNAAYLGFHPVEPVIDLIEPLVDLDKALVDLDKTLVDLVEPLIDLNKALVDLVEPVIDVLA